MRTPISSLNNR